MRSWRSWLLLPCLLLAPLSLSRQEGPRQESAATSQEVELPPPRSEYLGRRIAQTMHWSGAEWLLRETREAEEHSSRMIAALGLEPGQTVCDLGCGVGAITLPLARRLVSADPDGPVGRVLAVDIQPEMLAGLRRRAEEAGITNVEPLLGGPADPHLPRGSCDLVLMVDVYHELGYPERVLAAVRAALKPRGRLVLVEFRGEDPEVPIKPEHKMTRAQVQRELGANGFRLERAFEELPWQHMLFYQRDDAPPAEVPQSDGPPAETGER